MRIEQLNKLRGFVYKIIGPLRYKSGEDYNAERYWHDRFRKYGLSIRGAGNVNFSEQENLEMYKNSARILTDLFKTTKIDLASKRVLEIGCGTGFYTKLLFEHGVKQYLGLDITDVLIPQLKKKFPFYNFIKRDITVEGKLGTFDIILMINVIEHIVNERKFSIALRNIDDSLIEGGLFLVGAVMEKKKKHLFYVKYWTLDDIIGRLPKYKVLTSAPFQNGKIVILKK